MNITVYLGASAGIDQTYRQGARVLGKWIGENGHRLIYGGSREGLMGILADAVLQAGGEVIGVEPGFFLEDEVQHPGITQLIVTQTMAERREKMISLGEAFLAFPGGTGTLEELAEVISLKKLGFLDRPVIVLDLGNYYAPLKDLFLNMVKKEFLEQRHLEDVFFADSVEAAADHLRRAFSKMA